MNRNRTELEKEINVSLRVDERTINAFKQSHQTNFCSNRLFREQCSQTNVIIEKNPLMRVPP